MLELILLPVIGLFIAIFGIFFDAKKNPKSAGTIILVLLVLSSSFATGWNSWQKNSSSKAGETSAKKDKNLMEQALQRILMTSESTQKTTMDVKLLTIQMAAVLGIKPDSVTPEKVANSLLANDAIASITNEKTNTLLGTITVQYFPKEIDKDTVQETLITSLKDAGYNLKTGTGNPSLKGQRTNSIWYGKKVPDQAIRHLALSLSRAGIGIQGIQPFTDQNSKLDVIQVGASALVLKKPVLTVQQILALPIRR